MRAPRIRNGYLHFDGKTKCRKTERRRGTKRKREKGEAFFGPMLPSAIAPVATNLLNSIEGKIFQYARNQKKEKDVKQQKKKKTERRNHIQS